MADGDDTGAMGQGARLGRAGDAAAPASGAALPLLAQRTSDPLLIKPLEWESFTGIPSVEEPKQYKTDNDFQSIVEELASKIATPGSRAPLVAPVRPPIEELLAPAELLQVEEPVEPEGADAPGDDADDAPGDEPEASDGTGAVATPVLPAAPAPAPAGHVDVPVIVEAAASTANVAQLVNDEPPAGPPAAATPPEGAPSLVPALVAPGAVALAPAPAAAPVLAPTTAPVTVVAPQLARIQAPAGAPRPTKPVDFGDLLGGGAGAPVAPAPPKRRTRRTPRKQRHPIKFLFKLALLGGLLGGAAYAGKVYVLDVRWSGTVGEIADDVADERGLDWEEKVDVVALDLDEYSLRLASSMLGVSPAEATALSAQWRALGLVEGQLDLGAVGAASLPEQPAFYDTRDGTVYELAGMSEDLREIALTRALANALLDQHFGWGATVAASDPSVALGVRALFDGDAMSIQRTVIGSVLADPSRAEPVNDELAELRQDVARRAQGAPAYAVSLVAAPGRAAVHLFSSTTTPTPASRDSAVEIDVLSDASVFDGVRGRTFEPVTVPSPLAPADPAPSGAEGDTATTVAASTTAPAATVADATATTLAAAPVDDGVVTAGMVHWYHVLAGRLDPATAWDAALAWAGDATAVTDGPDGTCVTAAIATTDEAGRAGLLAALQAWASLAPAAAQTTVSSAGDLVEVRSCDPGTSATTFTTTSVPPFGDAPTELAVAGSMLSAGLPRSEAARTCVISAVRYAGPPTLVQSASVDPALSDRALDLTSQGVRDLMEVCGSQ